MYTGPGRQRGWEKGWRELSSRYELSQDRSQVEGRRAEIGGSVPEKGWLQGPVTRKGEQD